jgi:hypothetical protein
MRFIEFKTPTALKPIKPIKPIKPTKPLTLDQAHLQNLKRQDDRLKQSIKLTRLRQQEKSDLLKQMNDYKKNQSGL